MSESPLISICLPNLNGVRFLAPRMDSILAQTCTDWELIICDSYSDDGSWEFFQGFRDDPRVHLHRVPREGLYAGWNECLKRARGEFIYMATSDDTAEVELLEYLHAGLLAHPDVDIAACQHYVIDEEGRRMGETGNADIQEVLRDSPAEPTIRPKRLEFAGHALVGPTWVTMTSVLFRRSLLEKTGLFPTRLAGAGDLVWAMTAALYTDTLWLSPSLATWRRHERQATQREPRARNLRARLDCLKAVRQTHSAQLRADDDAVLCGMLFAELVRVLGVDRQGLMHHPRRFLRGCGLACRTSPKQFLGHLARGLPADDTQMLWLEKVRAYLFDGKRPWSRRECDPK